MRISFPFSIFVCSGGLSGTLELKVVRFWSLIVAFFVVFYFRFRRGDTIFDMQINDGKARNFFFEFPR